MSNSLIIIYNSIESDRFFDDVLEEFDILALTSISMLSLDALKIPYYVTDDLYNTDLYRCDVKNIIIETENVLNKSDKFCQNIIQFPFSYSGNSNYILHELLDLFYIDKLCSAIKKSYNNIYLISNTPNKKLIWDELTYSDLKSHPKSESLSINLTAGIENKLQIIRDILDIKIIPYQTSKLSRIPYYVVLQQKFYKFKSISIKGYVYIRKCINNKKIPFYEKLMRNKNNIHNIDESKKTIFIIQDNYEVASLKQYLSDYNIINPVSALRKNIPDLPHNHYDFNKIKTILEPFLIKNYKMVSRHIYLMFKSYHREVVGRISYYIEAFEELIDEYNPHLNLCSIGSRDVIDCVFNYYANQREIPVVYFQHGGTLLFFNDEYQKYVGADAKIRKTLILNSSLEKKVLEHKDSQFIPLGSIQKFYLLKNNSEKNNNHKAIYCTAPFPYENYRSLSTGNNDQVYYNSSDEIITAAKKASIIMNIKPHPVNFISQINYYLNLVKMKKYNFGKIIANIPAEGLLKTYGLIIIDFLGTALIPYILSLKVPVVLYLKDKSLINKLTFEDLTKRCYIADDPKELEELFHLYSQNKLPSKWSEKIIDRYVYPIANGNPGPNIAEYITSL